MFQIQDGAILSGLQHLSTELRHVCAWRSHRASKCRAAARPGQLEKSLPVQAVRIQQFV